jgi:ADP-ribosylglycohydrolase
MTSSMSDKRASGCLFGLALGDALGADTEFLSYDAILRRFPVDGPQMPSDNPIRVTDDTQMTLAVGNALQEAAQPYTTNTLKEPLRQAFVTWNTSPDNNRAPGVTCMDACNKLATGLPWQQCSVIGSKGCGANMRVAPVGLLSIGTDGVTVETRAAIAQFQAALTHGHPTGLAAADLTAAAIADLATGGDTQGLPQRLRAYAHSQQKVYHEEWLGSLWKRSQHSSPQDYIAHGWDECLQVLDRLDRALVLMDRVNDPCQITGAGWIAEEALATGLLCFLLFPDDPVAAIKRAAASSGDSDSIACLTGAFAGAYAGLKVWPEEWVARIEYREQLIRLGERWDAGR